MEISPEKLRDNLITGFHNVKTRFSYFWNINRVGILAMGGERIYNVTNFTMDA